LYSLELLGLSAEEIKEQQNEGRRLLKNPLVLPLYLVAYSFAFVGALINGPLALLSSFLGRLLARGEIVEQATYKVNFTSIL
jgi:hypothetical protein